jgi:hypothetical protein
VSIAACTTLGYAVRQSTPQPIMVTRPVVPGPDGLPLLGIAVPPA